MSTTRRYVLTHGGRRRLERRLEQARFEWKAVCDDNPDALASGDTSGWHDNFAFEENQRQMHWLAHRIRELERVLDAAEVVPPLREAPEAAVLGASIVWRFEGEETERTCWLAGWGDGDPGAGRISYDSPIGRALLGARRGEEREVELGGRVRRLEVIELGPTPAGEDG